MKRKITIILLLILLLTGCGSVTDQPSGDSEITQSQSPEVLDITDQSHPDEGVVSIPMIKSPVDFNGNGEDDYTDFLSGARLDVGNNPRYDGSFYAEGGYPPDDIGVCTDTVWRAFRHAGYSLKDMVDRDIRENLSEYPRIDGVPEPNIDFRRVPNLVSFFERYAVSLTLDKTEIEEWNGGDIVVFAHPEHIAIVSDRRNSEGIPYIIHNAGRPEESDRMDFGEITGHFRFDAGRLGEADLIRFEE